MRQLEKLHVELTQLPENVHAIDDLLRHTEELYLKDLQLSYSGPGFASLNAASLRKLHVETLQLQGFSIRNSSQLANKHGRLQDCKLDISALDLKLFYNNARDLDFERCRLLQSWSWRLGLSICAAVALTLAVGIGAYYLPAATLLCMWSAYFIYMLWC